MIGTMHGVYFCNAHDAVAGNSENTSSDEALRRELVGSHAFTVNADGSGCDAGAGWCLHDTPVTASQATVALRSAELPRSSTWICRPANA